MPPTRRALAADGRHGAHGRTRRTPPRPLDSDLPLLPFFCPSTHLTPSYLLDMIPSSRVPCTRREMLSSATIAASTLHGCQTIPINPDPHFACHGHHNDPLHRLLLSSGVKLDFKPGIQVKNINKRRMG